MQESKEGQEGQLPKLSWKSKLAISILVVAVVGVVDIPQTVRIKAMIIKALPLHHETTISLIKNLCKAAHNTKDGASNCYYAHQSVSAEMKQHEAWKAKDKKAAAERAAANKAEKAIEAELAARLPAPPLGLPTIVELAVKRLIVLQTSYDKKAISQTDYKEQVLSEVRYLRALSPRYREYIDNVIKGVTGIDPARLE